MAGVPADAHYVRIGCRVFSSDYRHNGVLDAWCEKERRHPAAIERSVNLHMHMGANDADARRIANERGGPLAAVGAVSGTPQRAIETIKTYEEAGASRVSIVIRPP